MMSCGMVLVALVGLICIVGVDGLDDLTPDMMRIQNGLEMIFLKGA